MTTAPAPVPYRVLGIDPGVHGGFALVDRQGRLLHAEHFPLLIDKKRDRIDGPALARVLNRLAPTHAYVEAVGSRPRQAGQFQFGLTTGMIHGILHAQRVPLVAIAPASWKAAFNLHRAEDTTKSEMKSQARALAARLFPEHAARFARVKDDGVAEAALIALYGLSLAVQR